MLIANFFAHEGEGIGGFGPKNMNMLISAIGRQHVSFGGKEKWPTIHEKAATLLFGMVMNHPFHDANKRTAFLSTVHYLYVHGFQTTVTEKEFEDMTVSVASGGLGKFRRFKKMRSDKVGVLKFVLLHIFCGRLREKLIKSSILLAIEILNEF